MKKPKQKLRRKRLLKRLQLIRKRQQRKLQPTKKQQKKRLLKRQQLIRKQRQKKPPQTKKRQRQKLQLKKPLQQKRYAEADDIFGELSSGKNAPKTGGGAKGNNASPAGSGNTKNNGASGADINNYAGQIKSAIESKFYDASSYAGKTCTLRIKLAPDGMLLDIKPEGGDPALCQAALAAAKLAKIPKPPSQAVYEVFKNAPLDFKP
ncbi:cell envelope integrity protein TolA [Escherichia coli]|nr:cell envelope integrity protein TolA [Escherichia coli]